MNNPAFYPKAAFKIKLPAEAPHTAARRGKQGPQCIALCGYYVCSPRVFLLLAPSPLRRWKASSM